MIKLSDLTNDDIFKLLKKLGVNAGPVEKTTRSIYEKKLISELLSKNLYFYGYHKSRHCYISIILLTILEREIADQIGSISTDNDKTLEKRKRTDSE